MTGSNLSGEQSPGSAAGISRAAPPEPRPGGPGSQRAKLVAAILVALRRTGLANQLTAQAAAP
jgi:hypothetical protein